MKNWMKLLATGVLALGLAACGETAEPKTGPGTGENEENAKSELTAQEVYEKAQAASEEQQSMHAVMDLDQTISAEGQEIQMKMKMDMDMIIDPLAMHQHIEMSMPGEDAMEMELYMTDQGFYMNDPESGQWMKLPNDMYEEMVGQIQGSMDPTLDLDAFQDYVDEFEFEQTDDAYILTLKASGEEFTELMKELMKANMPPGLEGEELDALNNINVKSMDIKFSVDKETFFTKDFVMDLAMTIEEDGQVAEIAQHMKGDISKINEIEEIVIPEEVLNDAVDITEQTTQ